MCGLAGLIMAQVPRSPRAVRYLRDVFTVALADNASRGTDATGVGWLGCAGGAGLLKRGVDVWTYLAEGGDAFIKGIPREATVVLGHTRNATCGDPADNANNHPIQTGGVIGTHNGVIRNASALRKLHGLAQRAEVDSEALFALAALHTPAGQPVSARSFAEALEDVVGTMSFVLVARHDPRRVYLFRGDNPLHARWHHALGAMVYSSTQQGIKRACVGAAWSTLALPHNVLVRVTIEPGAELRTNAYPVDRGGWLANLPALTFSGQEWYCGERRR